MVFDVLLKLKKSVTTVPGLPYYSIISTWKLVEHPHSHLVVHQSLIKENSFEKDGSRNVVKLHSTKT